MKFVYFMAAFLLNIYLKSKSFYLLKQIKYCMIPVESKIIRLKGDKHA